MPHIVTVWHRQPQAQNIITSTLRRTQIAVHNPINLAGVLADTAPYLVLGTIRLCDLEVINTIDRLTQQRPGVQIVVLCARGNDSENVHYYRAGAQLCLANTTSLQVLTTYLETCLRRSQQAESRPINLGQLTLHPSKRQVAHGNSAVPLRKREYDILHLLATHRGHAMHRNTIHARTSKEILLRDAGAVDVHIHHIRRKLRLAGLNTDIINTIPGYGYCIH